MSMVYKVLPSTDWQAAQRAGTFHGSPVDLRDGFIHFSTAEQLAETLRRHFAGMTDLVLLRVDTAAVTPESAWRWEPSRGGALSPPLYAPRPASAGQSARALPLAENGEHQLPE